MKLSELRADSETFSPQHPSMGDVGITFTIHSPFSREHNSATARLAPELLKDGGNWEVFQAESVMSDWSGIEDADGNPIPFSAEKCAELFRDPAFFWMPLQVCEVLAKKKGYLQTILNRLKHSPK